MPVDPSRLAAEPLRRPNVVLEAERHMEHVARLLAEALERLLEHPVLRLIGAHVLGHLDVVEGHLEMAQAVLDDVAVAVRDDRQLHPSLAHSPECGSRVRERLPAPHRAHERLSVVVAQRVPALVRPAAEALAEDLLVRLVRPAHELELDLLPAVAQHPPAGRIRIALPQRDPVQKGRRAALPIDEGAVAVEGREPGPGHSAREPTLEMCL